MEREMALASSAVLRGKRLVASRDVMADSCGKTQIAARVVALNRPNRQTDRARGSYRRAEVKWKPASPGRSEEHTSELQSLMRISYAVFCLKKKTKNEQIKHCIQTHN